MVRVFKCHSFASQHVIPISKEPLIIYADNDRVFVATNDCEIIVFRVSTGTSTETQRWLTISQVDKIVYNSFRNYIATIELKKSWKGMMKSVRIYLNWEVCTPDAAKSTTKVRVAGKSHVQHVSSSSESDVLEIVEVPLEENASSVAVCKYTGNFAVAFGSEVKLCSIVEKTVANSDKTYLDVEVFLELCWNFPVKSISLCEEFIICSSQKEVQGIRVRYKEGEKKQQKRIPISASCSVELQKFSQSNQVGKGQVRLNQRDSNLVPLETAETSVVDDENFVEWNFLQVGHSTGGTSLPSLYASSTQSQCYNQAHIISPPVLSEFSGGKGKSISGIHAETVLYLSDSQEKEEWSSVTLIPTYSSDQNTSMWTSSVSTDRMRSVSKALRTSVCCYISGTRGGYLYQISPLLTHVSSYKYTDRALQVGVSQNYLHIVTRSGIETYTSRWGVVSLEMQERAVDELDTEQIHPPSCLDICLCGHEPFFGVVSLSVGAEFLVLMSKVEDVPSSEVHWGLYVLHDFSLVDLYKDMISFADKIKITGPSSYIHLLQEAHLLLSTSPLFNMPGDSEVKDCYREVCRKLGEYYSLPWQDDWALCWPYYRTARTSVEDMVNVSLEQSMQTKPQEFGSGLIDCLDHILFARDGTLNLPTETCDAILSIYAASAPEKLSQVILLSNMKLFSTETAFLHLKLCLSQKSSASQPISSIDKLAMVQYHLTHCEVDAACSELNSINKSSLVALCSSHPVLIYDKLNIFTPISQLMRQHMSATLLEILVEMLDKGVMSLDSLLILLKKQSDLPYNNHTKEFLELILSDEKRTLLFQEAAQMLCEIYIAKLKEKSQPSPKQMTALAHQKFSLPQGNGHFAQRFAWLDYLPPFQGPTKMARPCQRLEVKHIPGQGSRTASLPITMMSRQVHKEKCQCFVCNENLLKLQSLLCSSHLTSELASYVIHQLDDFLDEDQNKVKETGSKECWDSVRLLCLVNLDLEKAIEKVVDSYPRIIGMFATSCFSGNVNKYGHLLRSLEMVIKACAAPLTSSGEETYVKAYKDLLSRAAELFPPTTFLELLPADGSLYFLLPYLCASLKLHHTDKLKQKIVDMGKDLLTH